MNVYRSFAYMVIGRNHTKHSKGCEDASFHYDGDGVSIAVAADGHGDYSCFRSDRGAQFAVDCAAKGIEEFVKRFSAKRPGGLPSSQEEAETILRELLIKQGIINAWRKKVSDDCAENPFTKEELKNAAEEDRAKYEKRENIHDAYGTTLIAAAITSDYWFGIQIGDGRLTALYPDGTYDQPVPWDERCYRNVTTSLCDEDASSPERFRCYFSFHKDRSAPVAVFLCTDGIDDNYPSEENGKYLFGEIYRTAALTFAEDGFELTCNLLKIFADDLAADGKGDDTSIAFFVDMEAVKQTAPIWKAQVEGK